jgi:hypothetical protein
MKPLPCLAARSATTVILVRADWSAIRDTFHSAAEEVRVPVRERRFLAWAAGIITNELQHGRDPLTISGTEKNFSAVANACADLPTDLVNRRTWEAHDRLLKQLSRGRART